MDNQVRILNDIVPSFIDYPDNSSIAICVVMMGCTHNCKGCQNPLFQNPNYEKDTRIVTVENLCNELNDLCERNMTNKVVLSGGDCLSPYNINFTRELIKQKQFDFCLYTGYNIDYVINNNIVGYKFIKCGVFDKNCFIGSDKDEKYMQFATSNQKLYNDKNILLSNNGRYDF